MSGGTHNRGRSGPGRNLSEIVANLHFLERVMEGDAALEKMVMARGDPGVEIPKRPQWKIVPAAELRGHERLRHRTRCRGRPSHRPGILRNPRRHARTHVATSMAGTGQEHTGH